MTGTLLYPGRVAVSAELVDLIPEAVATPASAAARAVVIATMLLGILDAVTWRGGPGGDADEPTSLLQVVQAAAAHQQRMTPLADHHESAVADR